MYYCPRCAASMDTEGLCAKCAVAAGRGWNAGFSLILRLAAVGYVVCVAMDLFDPTRRRFLWWKDVVFAVLFLGVAWPGLVARLFRRLPRSTQEWAAAPAPPRPWYVHWGIVFGIIALAFVFSRPAVLALFFPR